MRRIEINSLPRAFFFALIISVWTGLNAVAAGKELHSTNRRAIGLYEEGLELAEREQFDRALDKLKAAIDTDPRFLEAHLRYMDAFRSVGRGEEVVEMYSTMRDKNPDSPMFNFLYGRTANDLNEKRAAFRKTLSLDPQFYYAQFGIGGSYMLEGRLNEAIMALNKALEIKPGMTDALRLLGSIYMDKGMPLQARTALERAITVDSNDVQVLLRLGQTYSQLERYESAEKTFRRAAALEPEEPLFFYYIGLVCEMNGRPAEAAENLERFLRMAPDHEMAPSVRKMAEKLKKEAG